MKCPRCGMEGAYQVPALAAISEMQRGQILSFVNPNDLVISSILALEPPPMFPVLGWFREEIFGRLSVSLAIYYFRKAVWAEMRSLRLQAIYCPECDLVYCGDIVQNPYSFYASLKEKATQLVYEASGESGV